jgi:hypothetical protein
MSNVTNDTTDSNVVDSSDNALAEATAIEQKKIDNYKASEARLVELAIATLDPKDMLKKYAKLGKEAIGLGFIRMESLAVGSWNGQKDWDKVCEDLETLVRMRIPVKEIRMSTYARTHLFVEAMRPMCPNIEKLSYYQVASKFLPTLSFDASDLTGSLKKDWIGFLRVTIEKQLSDNPMPMKELDEAIATRKKEIEAERAANSKRTPEQILEAEQKAADKKLIKERSDVRNKITSAVSDALKVNNFGAPGIVGAVEDAFKLADLPMPGRLVGFDPINCTVEDCKTLAKAMLAGGKLAEMVVLKNTLDVMIKIAQNQMVGSIAQ